MKFFKPLFFTALLVAIAIPVVASAQDHPTNEHPSKKQLTTEHPAAPEHPGKITYTKDSILAKIAADGRFTQFIAAIEAADLAGKLQEKGPFTIFVPTDDAFGKLPEGTLADLMKPANHALLAGLLANHVVPGKLVADAAKTMKAANVSGRDLDIQVADGHWTVDGAQVLGEELEAGNGVIHAIDMVLLPPKSAEHPEKATPKDHPGH